MHHLWFTLSRPALFCALVVMAVPALAGPGDLDGDDSVTFSDAAHAARIASGLEPSLDTILLTGDVASAAGKVRDRQVTLIDALLIARAAVGLEPLDDAHAPAESLYPIQRKITISDGATVDAQFEYPAPSTPTAYLVTGQVTEQPGVGDQGSIQFSQFAAGGTSGRGAYLDKQGTYRVEVAAGEYSLYYGNVATEQSEGGEYRWPFRVPLGQTVTISGSRILNIAGGSPPIPGTLIGSLTTSNLVPTGISGRSLDTGLLVPFGDATGIVNGADYSLKAVPASYTIFDISGYFSPDPDVTFLFAPATRIPVSIAGGETTRQDFSLPSVVPVTFQMSAPEGATITSLLLSGQTTVPQGSYRAPYTVPAGSDVYRSAAPPGAFRLYVYITTDDPSVYRRTITYRAPVVVPDAGGSIPVSLPPLPATVTVQGRITYPNGAPAAGASVSLSQLSVADLVYTTSVTVLTDGDGRYSVQVPQSDTDFEFVAVAPRSD